jgi:hypothetical protein
VAVLKVYGDGRVKYNEQDVTQQAQNLCALRQPATPQNNAFVPPASSAQPIRQQVDAQLRHPSSYPPGSPERQAAMQNLQQQQPAAQPGSTPASLNAVAPAAGGQAQPQQEPLGNCRRRRLSSRSTRKTAFQ